MTACPYGVRTLDKKKHVPEKCKFCADTEQMPNCVSTCMCEVRVFGDVDDPNSKISKMLATNGVYQLLPEKGTRPRIYYLRK
jgi:Fe-S-cluster-containing dehydrogenase component